MPEHNVKIRYVAAAADASRILLCVTYPTGIEQNIELDMGEIMLMKLNVVNSDDFESLLKSSKDESERVLSRLVGRH